MNTKKFFKLNLLDATQPEWFASLDHILTIKNFTLIFTPNPEQIMLAKKNPTFHTTLQQADILLPDGTGLVWAARIKTRLTGVDTVTHLLSLAQKHHLTVLLIGGRYGDNPQLTINHTTIFYTSGYQNITQPTTTETNTIKQLIVDIKPDIVFAAFGAPHQEEWLIAHRDFLRQHQVRLAMAVGGSFDFLTGKVKRAPLLWQQAHLEWFWRLLHQPWRLKRQLALLSFIFFALKQRRATTGSP